MHMARPKPLGLALILHGLARFVIFCSVAGIGHCVSNDTKIEEVGWAGIEHQKLCVSLTLLVPGKPLCLATEVVKILSRMELLPYIFPSNQPKCFVFNCRGMAGGMQLGKGRRSGAHRGAFERI